MAAAAFGAVASAQAMAARTARSTGRVVALGAMMSNALPPFPAPAYQGSLATGVFASLACQFVALIAPVPLLLDTRPADQADEAYKKAVDRRQGFGAMLMACWGLTHWVLVLPVARRWKRRGELRAVKGLYVVSCLALLPAAVFGTILLLPLLGNWSAVKK
jgi:hypothetical protein